MKLKRIALSILAASTLNTANALDRIEEASIEEVSVIADRLFSDTTVVSPASKITVAELANITLLTSEDAVAFEPSLVIRRRFVGDPNGVLGIRGSGQFQTTHSLVFADGLPLHYLLQTRFSGSPRWSLVGPDEIESAEVIYGPFSAEYSGNAIGGVVDIKTRTPQERRFIIQGTLLSQDYDLQGTDERFNGNKVFLSYEDRIGDFSVYASYNRLDNQSQPLTDFFVSADELTGLQAEGVTGFIEGRDDHGREVLYIGDSGAETAVTELYKVKLGYNIGNTELRGTLAYEDRNRRLDDLNNYLVDSSGETFFGPGNNNFQERFQDRRSLLLGFGISGHLNNDWFYDIYATDFDILEDSEVRTGRNPADPGFASRNQSFGGRLTEHGDTGWQTLDVKLGTERLLGADNLRLSVGVYVDKYQLEINPFNVNAITGEVGSNRSASGGETSIRALFTQWGWQIDQNWDLALGLRYEDWETSNGFLGSTQVAPRSENGLSPKFSLAYAPNDDWSLRYSLARAHRFPITEELYSNENRTTSIIISDPSLEAEEGIHHNFSVDRQLKDGFVRLNLFFDQIDDTIFNQNGTILDGTNNINVTTFLAIDQVETTGVEFIYNQQQIFGSRFDIRFNATYIDSEITENQVNPDIVGNRLPRVADWRANLILGYALSDRLGLSTSFRYAADAFGELDNEDTESTVFGAIDSYFFVNAKANWQVTESAGLSFGVDNLFNDLAYVHHPWPQRTLYLEGKYSF